MFLDVGSSLRQGDLRSKMCNVMDPKQYLNTIHVPEKLDRFIVSISLPAQITFTWNVYQILLYELNAIIINFNLR